MKKIYLITIPERLWHWLNAAFFITLALTGLLMHASENLEDVSLGALIRVHNTAAVLFVLDLGFWLTYQVLSGRIRHYFRLEKDFVWRLIIQVKFYIWDIFKRGPHPFPVTEDSKFNPLQRVTYLGLMFGLLPLQVLTGAIMYGFTLKIEWLMDLPHFRLIALLHTALSYLLMAFLVGHLYLATTGDTLFDLIRTMLFGYHTVEDIEEETHEPD